MAWSASAVAGWVNYASSYGVLCSEFDETLPTTRNSTWESLCVRLLIRFQPKQLEVGAKAVQYKELRHVQLTVDPKSLPPILQEAGPDVAKRVVTLKFQWTRQHLSTQHVIYVLFPTEVDSSAFVHGVKAVQQLGLKAVLAGVDGSLVAPHIIERAKELRKRAAKRMARLHTRALRLDQLGVVEVPAKEDFAVSLGGGMAPDLTTRREWMTLLDDGEPRSDLDALAEKASSTSVRQIELDLPRTWPHLSVDQQQLRLVLVAYAGYNPAIGYCQSMNMIAAVFLLAGFTATEAFHMFRCAMKRYCPKYHDEDLSGLLRDTSVIEILTGHLFPEKEQELIKVGIPMVCITADFLLTLFTKNFPLDTVLQLWEMIFREGFHVIFAAVLTLIDLHMASAVAMAHEPEAAEVMQKFRELAEKHIRYEPEEFLENVRRLADDGRLCQDVINALRDRLDG